MSGQPVMVYVTAPDLECARQLAQAAVSERLAACANILGAISSVYWWDGKVNNDDEIALIFKTLDVNIDALRQRLAALHPYECPCIVAVPISGGNPAFLDWIAAEAKPAATPSP